MHQVARHIISTVERERGERGWGGTEGGRERERERERETRSVYLDFSLFNL